MKKILYFIISIVFVVGLIGCSSKPPKIKDHESLEHFQKRIVKYLTDKMDEKVKDIKNITKYINKSNEIYDNFKKKVNTIKDKDKLVDFVDDTIEKLLDLSDKYINLSEDDYYYLSNPLKYYVDNSEDLDELPPVIKNMINNNNIGLQVWWGFNQGIYAMYYKTMVSPLEIVTYLLNSFDRKTYEYIVSHSKYKKLFYKK